MSEPIREELYLSNADEILKEYVEPDSIVDMGNLYFAATQYKLAFAKVVAENERLKGKLSYILQRVDKQALDEGLWFIAETVTEQYLQDALRLLHFEIETSARRVALKSE